VLPAASESTPYFKTPGSTVRYNRYPLYGPPAARRLLGSATARLVLPSAQCTPLAFQGNSCYASLVLLLASCSFAAEHHHHRPPLRLSLPLAASLLHLSPVQHTISCASYDPISPSILRSPTIPQSLIVYVALPNKRNIGYLLLKPRIVQSFDCMAVPKLVFIRQPVISVCDPHASKALGLRSVPCRTDVQPSRTPIVCMQFWRRLPYLSFSHRDHLTAAVVPWCFIWSSSHNRCLRRMAYVA
jgi:hypothetical protein